MGLQIIEGPELCMYTGIGKGFDGVIACLEDNGNCQKLIRYGC